VSIADDGGITIFEEDGTTVLAKHTVEDMFGAFGMDVPVEEAASAPEID
jgi:hypothetical protein